jgi:hypothetical protein
MRKIVVFLVATVVALVLHNPANAFGGGGRFGHNHFQNVTGGTGIGIGTGIGTGYGGAGGSGFGGTGGGAFVSNSSNFAAMAYAPPAYPTATCLKAYSGGGSGIGFGFSAGITVVDTECRIYEGMRAIVNAANNNMIDRLTAKRMMMDITCDAETMATTRDCKTHLAMREEEDNRQMIDVVINTDTGAMEEITEVTTKRAKFEDLFPWNWGS